jgi:hypothetical protein
MATHNKFVISRSSCLLRYHLQEFINVAEADLPALKSMDWPKREEFGDTLLKIQQSTRTMVVPHLLGSPGYERLRLKVIDSKEYAELKQASTQEIERVESACKEIVFFFGFEDHDLALTPGRLFSYWAKDPRVTKLQVTYAFAKASLNAFGLGYDSRHAVPSQGLSLFIKDDGRGTKRPFSSPLQADEDISKQQYYRVHFKDQLAQPRLRKIINELADNVSSVARAANPILMNEVGNICTRKILTTGEVPSEGRKALPPHILPQGGSSKWPILGFANATHCDQRDRLTGGQCQTWKQKAHKEIEDLATSSRKQWMKDKKKASLESLLMLCGDKDFCLPTTCGYQFVFQGDAAKEELEVSAFFKMDGLGVAIDIQHGVMQHFMGAMFSHQTCLPIVQKDGRLSANNADNNFLIVGWGSNGGSAEVAEAVAALVLGSVVEDVERAEDVEAAAGRVVASVI